jgi:DNA-binding beta-propeller fold protein YncE
MRTPSLVMSALAAGTLAASGAHAAPPGLAVTGQIAGPDGGWDYVTFDPVHRRLYVSRSDGIMAIDVDTDQVTPRLVEAQRTHVAVPVNQGDELVVTSTTAGAALIADARTGAVRATIKTGAKPDGAFLEPESGLVWVLDNAGGGIALIDPKAGAKVATIAVPGALESAALDGKGRAFVNVEDRNEIAVVAVKTRKLVARYKLPGCEEPNGLAYGEGRLVAACANGVAKVIRASDGKDLATLPIGPRPDTALYDPARKLVYIPTAADAKLVLISPAQAKVVGVVATHTGARTQALDPKTDTLYLPAADYTPPAQPNGRPQPVPGSFRVLKVSSK